MVQKEGDPVCDVGARGQRIHFVSNHDREISKVEAVPLFSELNMAAHRGLLKDWVIVIEVGYRFSQDVIHRAFLIEARKFTRKVILVTTDWRIFEGVA